MHSPNCGGGKGLEAIMNDHDDESEKLRQLTADLQKTALSLIKLLRTNNFRIRIEGLAPAVYITLGEGRSSYSADSVMFEGRQGEAPGPAPNTAQAAAQVTAPVTTPVAPQKSVLRTPLLACFSRLRKALAA
jgi:hypothetical protein